eukprot:95278-Amphidinium_carterae.1
MNGTSIAMFAQANLCYHDSSYSSVLQYTSVPCILCLLLNICSHTALGNAGTRYSDRAAVPESQGWNAMDDVRKAQYQRNKSQVTGITELLATPF